MPATQTSDTTRSPQGIQLINKDYARRTALGLSKQIAHSGRAHANEHLNKLRTTNRKEGNAGLTRHSSR
ncbi:MAG: hypothetical protein BWY75_03846 [bacterium ADurb.Bin425]|nr:MAG: hypothetical protein BWY75_03846 [bacterium ADurb.Bin425]